MSRSVGLGKNTFLDGEIEEVLSHMRMYLNCAFCGKYLDLRASQYLRFRNGQRYFFCSKSCNTKNRLYFNNPASNPIAKQKISIAQKRSGKWTGENNPNYNGAVVKPLIAAGKYKFWDRSGNKNPAWIDGRSFERYGRGPDWRIQRLAALRRDKQKCTICGIPARIVHHIIPYNMSKDNSLNNLMTVCGSCHGQIHTEMRKETGFHYGRT